MTSAADTGLRRPQLTLPEAEAEALREAYAAATVILEYGTGGSTAVAADLGKTIFAVESDAAWVAGLQAWVDTQASRAEVHLHHANIGPTGDWGIPTDPASYARFPGYALSVWSRPDFQAPDTVLVDGRFRVSCFVTACLMTTRPLRLLFDDYGNRPHYHIVERLAPPVARAGRMAIFDISPMTLAPQHLPWVADSFVDQR